MSKKKVYEIIMTHFKALVIFWAILFWGSLSLYCMEKNVKKFEWKWDEQKIKKSLNNQRMLSIRDTEYGDSALLYVLKTLTYTDNPHYLEPYFIIRTYSYLPDELIYFIKKSDLSMKNKAGHTALDLLLQKIGEGFFNAINLFGNYYVFNESCNAIGNKLCMAQSFLLKIMQAVQCSGYDFKQNKQTTFQALGKNFSYDFTTVIKELLRLGISIDTISGFCTETTFISCIQSYDYEYIKKNEQLDELLSNAHKNKGENQRFFYDVFIRSMHQKNKAALQRFGKLCPSLFSPLKAFEYAINYNDETIIPFILRSFHKKSLINLSAKIRDKNPPYKSSGYDQKLYTLFKRAEKKEQYRLCSAVQNYTNAVVALANTTIGNHRISGILEDTILCFIV